MTKKEHILKLRKQYKSYNEIIKLTGYSKGIISYYCGSKQLEKTRKRTKNRRKLIGWLHNFEQKIDTFRYRKYIQKSNKIIKTNFTQLFYLKILGFISRNTTRKYCMNKSVNKKTILEKIGKNPTCYLTGRKINLKDTSTYHFDHIIPASKGGTNELDNLGLVCKEINIAKNDKTPEEFIKLCIEVLEYNGYSIKRES